LFGDLKAAPDIRFKRAGNGCPVCTAGVGKRQGRPEPGRVDPRPFATPAGAAQL